MRKMTTCMLNVSIFEESLMVFYEDLLIVTISQDTFVRFHPSSPFLPIHFPLLPFWPLFITVV